MPAPKGPAAHGGLRAWLGRLLRRSPVSPVVREWEWYARDYARGRVPRHAYLGADWNAPETIGIDLPAERVVAHLLDEVVLPFLGEVEQVLEIGCGAGRFTLPLAERVPRVLAADTSPSMLRLLRERLPAGREVTTLLLDGRGLTSLPSHSIPAAFSYDVFVHLDPHDAFLYLEELRRVLHPGGRAVIHHAHTFSALGWAKFRRDHEAFVARQPGKGRFTLMTPEVFRELAARAGLVLRETRTDVVRRDAISFLAADPPAPGGAA